MRQEYLREAHTGSASSQLLTLLSAVPEPVFVNILRSPGIDSQTWRAGTTTIFDVPAHQATKAGGNDALDRLLGSIKCLQIRVLSLL